MTATQLLALVGDAVALQGCAHCAALASKGWESLPGGFDTSGLVRIASLQQQDSDDATLAEHHPAGTHSWSADAPIALGWFPYNRCQVWACAACGKPFLRYTEVGGYYTDERIRELQPHLVC
jgi:hypothetical protein